MRPTARIVSIALAALMAAPVAVVLGVGEAHAVIGRPMTPVSYAGVARRTARRTTHRQMAYGSSSYGAGIITSLPSGCARTTLGATLYYGCGGTYYRPYYQGSTVVYQVAHP